MMSLSLILNMFHTFINVFTVDFEQVNVCWDIFWLQLGIIEYLRDPLDFPWMLNGNIKLQKLQNYKITLLTKEN